MSIVISTQRNPDCINIYRFWKKFCINITNINSCTKATSNKSWNESDYTLIPMDLKERLWTNITNNRSSVMRQLLSAACGCLLSRGSSVVSGLEAAWCECGWLRRAECGLQLRCAAIGTDWVLRLATVHGCCVRLSLDANVAANCPGKEKSKKFGSADSSEEKKICLVKVS